MAEGAANGGGGPPTVNLPPQVFRSNLSNISCRWSPFDGTKLAMAQGQYFGMVGTGAISILNVDAGGITEVKKIETPETTFDVCFNEAN